MKVIFCFCKILVGAFLRSFVYVAITLLRKHLILNKIIMVKKLISILLALAAMCSTMPMRGDSPPERSHEIPVKKSDKTNQIRSLCEIQAYYNGMLSTVCSSVASDLGEIDVTVTNCTTGEFWEDTFNSSLTSLHLLQISSTSGFYEVTYTTSCGNLYEGSFVIY